MLFTLLILHHHHTDNSFKESVTYQYEADVNKKTSNYLKKNTLKSCNKLGKIFYPVTVNSIYKLN